VLILITIVQPMCPQALQHPPQAFQHPPQARTRDRAAEPGQPIEFAVEPSHVGANRRPRAELAENKRVRTAAGAKLSTLNPVSSLAPPVLEAFQAVDAYPRSLGEVGR
jgi:hypothetical protein